MFDNNHHNTAFAILSAHRGVDHWADMAADERLGDMLKFAFPESHVVRCQGVYQGTPEQSWLVFIPDTNRQVAYNLIDALSKSFDQECWFEGYTQSCCYLTSQEGDVTAVGYWKRVPAPSSDNYTIIEGSYYETVTLDCLG